MDARVTKHRLGNMLSYDWLKILCTIAVVVVALVLFFMMVRPKPARAQKFYVHVYGGYTSGERYYSVQNELPNILSYDVLDTRLETFGNDWMSEASYTARRSSGEGSVAIVADYTASEGGTTPFVSLVQTGISGAGTEQESLNMFYEADKYFEDLDAYMVRFFGENWRTAPVLDESEVEICFRARNVDGPNNKNRFRSKKQIAAGIAEETERLETLRKNYVWLLDFGLGTERLPYAEFTSEIKSGETVVATNVYKAGICIGGLARLDEFLYYKDAEGKPARQKFNFLIYNNGTKGGCEDLRFEAVTFLRYIVEQFQ